MTRSRKVPFAALAAVSGMAVILTGCGSSSGDSSGGSDVLRVQVLQGDNNPDMGQAWIDGFKAENPGVEVEMELISGQANTSTNVAVLSGENPPDVGLIATGTAGYQALVADGALMDLAPVWEAADLDTRYPESLNQTLDYGGKHYSIGMATGYYNILYYNKDLFEEAGIDAPADHRIESVDDLADMVSQLEDVGAGGISFRGSSGFTASWMVDAFLPTAATEEELANYLSNYQSAAEVTSHYTDAPFIDSLAQMQELAEAGTYPNGYIGTDLGKATADFSAGRTGMLHQGFWAAQELIDANLPFEFDWLLLPPVEGSDTKMQLTSYFATGYSIPAGAANPELAQKFLEYMVSVDGQQKAVIDAGSQLPAVNDVPADAFENLNPYVQSMVADSKENGAQFGWTSAVPPTLGQNLIDPLIQEMYIGSKTPKQVGEAVEAQLEVTRAG